MKSIRQIILSVITSFAVFILFYSFFEVNAILSFIFAIAGFLGSFLVFSPKKFDPKLEQLEKVHGITSRQLKKVLKDGSNKIAVMKKAAQKINDEKIRNKVSNICQITDKIFKNFEHDPKDIKVSRQFLNYYLDATIKIIKQYVFLLEKKPDAENQTLKKVEKVMNRIESAFENQLCRLYEDDFMDLDAEISVLDKTIEMEGLAKK
jgi:5-bromo-4-chloroindolyl phosphate hydrolysis protein